jgi:hypothetical protein
MTTTAMPPTGVEPEVGFDFAARVDELRGHPNDVLWVRMADARRAQQRWRLEELAILKVLDDRNALSRMPDHKESARTRRAKQEVARSLADRPALARAFHDGDVSADQLEPLCELSTPDTDAEWAARGPNLSPADLHRRVRANKPANLDDERARHEARELRTWRDKVDGMCCGRWRLPAVDGALVEKVFELMAERRRPANGESWDTLAHRKADALVDLVTNYTDVKRSNRPIVEVVEIVDPRQQPGAWVNGEPISPEFLSQIKLNAKVRRCEADETGCHRTVQKPRKPLPADVKRHVRRRDQQCRVPGCEARAGLQIHHTEPICDYGDTHLVHKLTGVCPPHHRLLVPHGRWRLVGDAEDPDGLTLERVDHARDGPSP